MIKNQNILATLKIFHHWKAKNFLDNVTKSINTQTNTKSPSIA